MNSRHSASPVSLLRLLLCFSLEALLIIPFISFANDRTTTLVTIVAGVFTTAMIAMCGYQCYRFGLRAGHMLLDRWFWLALLVVIAYWIAGVYICLKYWNNVRLSAIVFWGVGDYIGNLIARKALARQ